MTNNEYLAGELARIGIKFAPESKEHRIIASVIEILTEKSDEAE